MKHIKPLLIILTFLIFSSNLSAQVLSSLLHDDTSNYQHLEWESKGYVKEYQVIIEEKQQTGYVEIINVKTKETYYDASLKLGSYRYKVNFYNMLGKLAFTTPYSYFEVKEATKPKIISHVYETFFLKDDFSTFEIVFSAKEISYYTTFKLVKNHDSKVELLPTKVLIDDNKVYLTFKNSDIKAGTYKLLAENPGGLTSYAGSVQFEEYQPVYYDIDLGFEDSFVLYDDFIETYFNRHTISTIADTDFTILYNATSNINFGGQFAFKFYPLNFTDDFQTLRCLYFVTELNGVFEVKMFSLMNTDFYFQLYGGMGASFLTDIHYSYNDDGTYSTPFYSVLPCGDLGANVKCFINKKIYIQTGVEYFSTFSFNQADYVIGALSYNISCGIRL